MPANIALSRCYGLAPCMVLMFPFAEAILLLDIPWARQWVMQRRRCQSWMDIATWRMAAVAACLAQATNIVTEHDFRSSLPGQPISRVL